MVYFSIRDEDQEKTPFAGMTLKAESPGPEPLDETQQKQMEKEVQRLLQLPKDELERQFRNELNYMEPQSKAPPPQPPSTMASMFRIADDVPERPQSSSGSMVVDAVTAALLGEESCDPGNLRLPEPTGRTCPHKEVTKKGSNAYINMVTCKQCGLVLVRERKDQAKMAVLPKRTPEECPHREVSWKGSNGYQWQWTCEECGKSEKHKKYPGGARPTPGGAPQPKSAAASSTQQAGAVRMSARLAGDHMVLFQAAYEWEQYKELLDHKDAEWNRRRHPDTG